MYKWTKGKGSCSWLLKVKSSMARILPVENLLPQNMGSIINYLHKSTEVLPVAVDHSQLQSMTSETVDKIDWQLPHPTQGSIPWAQRIARCKCGLQIARLAAATGMRTCVLGYARPTHCLCGHSCHCWCTSERKGRELLLIARVRPLVVHVQVNEREGSCC